MTLVARIMVKIFYHNTKKFEISNCIVKTTMQVEYTVLDSLLKRVKLIK